MKDHELKHFRGSYTQKSGPISVWWMMMTFEKHATVRQRG